MSNGEGIIGVAVGIFVVIILFIVFLPKMFEVLGAEMGGLGILLGVLLIFAFILSLFGKGK